jgi:hypothetical protein
MTLRTTTTPTGPFAVPPHKIRARYAVLRHLADGASPFPAERVAAGRAADLLLGRYPTLAVPDDGVELLDLDRDDAWAWGHLDVPGSAGLGRARTQAITRVLQAHGIRTVRVDWRHRNGDTRLAYYGVRPLVQHVQQTLPGILAALDAAALAATRRYRQWLRSRDDSQPEWHQSMCRTWRRDYLLAAGLAYASRLYDTARPPALTAAAESHTTPAIGHHNAHQIAADDALRLDATHLRAARAAITRCSIEALCAARRPDVLPGRSTVMTAATHPAPPRRLVLVVCGARKRPCTETAAGQTTAGRMYTGSYHQAARRAAAALAGPDSQILIMSARYGLLGLDDRIERYDLRLGQPGAITAQQLHEQATRRGLLHVDQVVVLAPAAYAALARGVWPHADLPLAGSRGIGEQLARLAHIAAGRVAAPPGTAATGRAGAA